jgi:hypothetical protein
MSGGRLSRQVATRKNHSLIPHQIGRVVVSGGSGDENNSPTAQAWCAIAFGNPPQALKRVRDQGSTESLT